MYNYKAPLRDYKFVMQELLSCSAHYQNLGYDDASLDLIDAILDEAAKFTEHTIAPINQVGDQGCQFNDGEVTTPPGFKEAYQQYIEGGWSTLSQSDQYGGQNLPHSLSTVLSEMLTAANHSFAMYPGLSHGCMATLGRWGTDDLKDIFLPKLTDGTWTGTMCLTEAHCGTDLGMLRTKAELNEDGSYRLNGSKIFISAGEHDLSENIVHLVIARMTDSPEGTKGISLFIVPKFNVSENGEITNRNGVKCGSIEHKMGINGSSTCVINFDNATGYLIGEKNRGLQAMFTFMNSARLGVANEGVASAEAAFQGSLTYARERLQSRSLSGVKNPEGPADPIIVHPDVRRMLLTQKSLAEGGRALVASLAHDVDIVHASDDKAAIQSAENRLALLTPIAKAFLTETAFDCTSLGVQIYGGHGYVKEWGMEQLLRDTKITCIYEGTTGIQALDLMGRKILGSKRSLLDAFILEIKDVINRTSADEDLSPLAEMLEDYCYSWVDMSNTVADKAQKDADEIGAASVDYLMFSGYVSLAYVWLRMALTAKAAIANGTDEKSFYQSKIQTSQFYFNRILPRAKSHQICVSHGADSIMAMKEEDFSF